MSERKRTKWTKDNVEVMWQIMTAELPRRTRGNADTWWAHIAQQFNDRSGLDVTAKACINKASEVHSAGRPYPWELAPEATATAAGEPDAPVAVTPTASAAGDLSALLAIERRLARIEEALEGRLPGTDIRLATNQCWAPRTANGGVSHGGTLCVVEVNPVDHTATLAEVGTPRVYVLPTRVVLRDYSHVGFRQMTVALGAAAGVTPPAAPQPPAPAPVSNGRRDLSSLLP